jgi:pyruvate formate lyase activating enzyme
MNEARSLRVGGLVPLSTTDFPDHLSGVIFCQGCAWRCAYCHNPHLLPRRGTDKMEWEGVLAFLERRRGLLDAVVFSGGEPTLQHALPAAIREVSAMGYKVGMHTAGISPRRLCEVLPLLNWVGMDIKASFNDYASVTGIAGSGERARECMELIIASGIDHEFRTTVQPSLLPAPQLLALARELAALGVRHYVLQECREAGAMTARLPEDLCHAITRMFATSDARRI